MAFAFLTAILLTHLGILIRRVQKNIDSLGGRAPGRVIGYVDGKSIRRGAGLYPVFKSVWKGEERYARSAIPALHPEFAYNQEVQLTFNEALPPRAFTPTNVFRQLSLATSLLAGTSFAIGLWMFQWEWTSFALLPMLILGTFSSFRAAKRPKNSKAKDIGEVIQTHLFQPCLSQEEVAGCKFISLSLIQERRTQYEQWVRRIALLVLIVGVGGSISAGRVLENRYRFVRSAQSAPGQVAHLEYDRGPLSITYPLVRFREQASEKELKFPLPMGSYPAYYRLGDKVEVLYDPKQPENAMIDWGIGNFIVPIFFLLIGLTFLAWSFKNYMKLNP